MPKKNCFLTILIVLIMLSGMVFSLSISAESPLVQGQQWTFSAELSSLTSGNEARVFVAGEQVMVIGRVGGTIVVADTTSSKVINYSKNGDTVTVVYAGLSSGSYELKVETDDESDSFEVVFFEPMNKADQQTMQDRIDSLETDLTNMANSISSLEGEISSKDQQISSLQQKNTELNSSIEYLQSTIKLLEQDGKTTDEILDQLKVDLNLLLTEREESMKSPLAGLFAFGAENSTLLIGLLALVALVVVGVFIKSRTGSIYSSPMIPKTDKDIGSPEDALVKESRPMKSKDSSKGFFSRFQKTGSSETRVSSKKKRWALESYSPKPEKPQENKRFELGDLIKKE